jgi:hypothetical protein
MNQQKQEGPQREHQAEMTLPKLHSRAGVNGGIHHRPQFLQYKPLTQRLRRKMPMERPGERSRAQYQKSGNAHALERKSI